MKALYSGSVWRTDGADCSTPIAEYVFKRLNPASELFEPWLWSKAHAPGAAEWRYSNAGFTIVGLVLETIFGVGEGGLDELSTKRLFSSLGMTKSSFFLKSTKEMEDVQVAIPHGYGIEHYGVCEYPAAGLRSTAKDLSEYLLAIICSLSGRGWPMEDGLLGLDEEQWHQLLPPGELCENGLAWWGLDAIYGNKKGRTWEHGGFMDGVRSHIYIWPHHRLGAVLMVNGETDYAGITFEMKVALAELLGVPMNKL